MGKSGQDAPPAAAAGRQVIDKDEIIAIYMNRSLYQLQLARRTGMKKMVPTLSFLLLMGTQMEGGFFKTASSADKGAIVEAVGKGSVADKAGLKPGDMLLAWERVISPADKAEAIRGEITSVFDLAWLQEDLSPRGTVRLSGRREGQPIQFELLVGEWKLAVRPPMPDGVLENYIKGKELIERKETAVGIDLWSNVSKWASENGDKSLHCWILQKIGETWASERNWEAALPAYQSVLKEAETANIPMVQVSSLKSIGRIHAARKEMEKAEAALRSALTRCQENWGRSLCLAAGHETLAGYYRQRGDVAQMILHLSQSLEIFLDLAPESPGAARVLNNMGVIELGRGNLKKAEEYYLRSMRIKEKISPESLTLAIALDNLGGIASYRGFLEEAESYKKRALEIEERVAPDSEDVAYTLHTLGIIAAKRTDLEAAESYLKRALGIYEKTSPNSQEMANCLINMGDYYLDIRDLEKAREAYFRSLEIKEAISPGSPKVATVLATLGNLAEQSGDLAEAETLNKQALEILERALPESWDVAYCCGNLATVAKIRGDYRTAEAYLQRALEIRTNLTPNSMLEAITQYEMAVLYEKTGRIPQAEDAYRQAIEILEAQMETLGGTAETKARFRQKYKYLYHDYLNLLNKRNKQQEAFHILERYRAQLFLAMLSERDIVWTAEVPEELDQERINLAREYDRIQNQLGELNSKKDREEIEKLQARLRELQAKQSEVIGRIKKTSPKYASLRYPQPLDVAGVQEALDPGTALLSYSIGEEAGYVFLVTSGYFEAFPLSMNEASLKEEIEKFNLAIQRGQSGIPLSDSFLSQGKKLYQQLIGPAEEIMAKCERILIVPDGPLHNLPFSALVRPNAGTTKDGSFLAEWKPIHIVLSATVFSELKKQRKPSDPFQEKKVLLAFGDPDYPQVEKDIPSENEDVIVRSMIKRGFDLAPLPGTREEVTSIVALFGTKGDLYLGKEATEERAKAIIPDIRFVHFACHGLLDDLFPLNSGLALSMPAEPLEGQENGILQAWEIFEQVRIDADLVALSACNTGSGKEMGGEGLVGLARAFQYAGARSVLASMWKVADVATSELMKRFYANLKSRMPKDKALQSAMKELIQNRLQTEDASGRTAALDASHPFYWAAFQLIGDWK